MWLKNSSPVSNSSPHLKHFEHDSSEDLAFTYKDCSLSLMEPTILQMSVKIGAGEIAVAPVTSMVVIQL